VLKATRFMRQPFFVMGYEVTLENMDEIAKWCEGHVIRDTEKPFVRVPVIRPTHERQTRGYVGTWVLVSKQRGEKSFKVYTREWLEKNFFEVPDDEIDASDLIPGPSSNLGTHFRSADHG
jgi:hypothetical protein